MTLPSPADLGAPARYTDWRPYQDDAVLATVAADTRFSLLVQPTGSGKSLTYVAAACFAGLRTVVLTSTKALQRQLVADFEGIGLRSVMGANAYACVELEPGGRFDDLRDPSKPAQGCDDGPCRIGIRCDRKDAGCLYYDAVRAAHRSQLVVTNYAYWCAVQQVAPTLDRNPWKGVDLLVLDEAHAAPDELVNAMTTTLTAADRGQLGMGAFPKADAPAQVYRDYASGGVTKLDAAITAASVPIKEATDRGDRIPRRAVREVQQLQVLKRKVAMLGRSDDTWVYIRERDRIRFGPSWPGHWAEDFLFVGIPRVVLTSATVRPKTCEYLGIAPEDVEVHEYPSTFERWRRPVIVFSPYPTVRMRHTITTGELRAWVDRIDMLIRGRLDRKGIIHTVSYARARYLAEHSQYRQHMIVPSSGAFTARDLATFRHAKAPSILVSPAVSTGHDFPGDQCRYQIIGKVPFPNTSDPVVRARQQQDPDYGMYAAMQTLVQAAGRGMRGPDDWCEVFIVDDQAKWFVKKYKDLAPLWFLETIKIVSLVPAPLAA